MWLKQVPLNNSSAEGVWSQKLIPGHRPVQRSRQRPTATVDAVWLQDLKAAAMAVDGNLDDPRFKRLHDLMLQDGSPR